jgi:hypothetical protein
MAGRTPPYGFVKFGDRTVPYSFKGSVLSLYQIAGASGLCGTHRSDLALLGKDKDMLKVVFPTVVGFAAMMSVWGVTAVTYMM